EAVKHFEIMVVVVRRHWRDPIQHEVLAEIPSKFAAANKPVRCRSNALSVFLDDSARVAKAMPYFMQSSECHKVLLPRALVDHAHSKKLAVTHSLPDFPACGRKTRHPYARRILTLILTGRRPRPLHATVRE